MKMMMRKLKFMHLHLLRKKTVRKMGNLLPIEDDAEWEMIEETLNTFLDEEEEEEEE